MPELPEVETIRLGLSTLLPGRVLVKVSYDWPKSFPNAETDVDSFLVGAEVLDVRRRAKVLIIDLNTQYSLVIHLKMTGQLVFVQSGGSRFGAGHPTDSLVSELPDKSTRVIFEFKDGSVLYFNDQRKFGWVRLVPSIEIENIDFFKALGPEPLSAEFTPAEFMERLKRRSKTSIKAALLDQKVIAGVGNIYADESLWAAGIHPAKQVNTVPTTKLKGLFSELQAVLLLSIERGGSTDRNYVNHEGKKGSYLEFAKVFRREGQPCLKHPNVSIQKIRVAGRGTHICPMCQKT